MKSLIARVALAAATALVFANCSSGGSSNNSTTATTATSYYMSNGMCYQSGTTTVVSTSYCTSTAGYTYQNGYCYNSAGQPVATNYWQSATSTGQYYMSNGYCYMNGSNIVVSTQLCSQNYAGNGGQSCQGLYYQYTGYGYQSVYCSGYNCSGATLLNQYGTQVRCY